MISLSRACVDNDQSLFAALGRHDLVAGHLFFAIFVAWRASTEASEATASSSSWHPVQTSSAVVLRLDKSRA
jgi:hypothetical protein